MRRGRPALGCTASSSQQVNLSLKTSWKMNGKYSSFQTDHPVHWADWNIIINTHNSSHIFISTMDWKDKLLEIGWEPNQNIDDLIRLIGWRLDCKKLVSWSVILPVLVAVEGPDREGEMWIRNKLAGWAAKRRNPLVVSAAGQRSSATNKENFCSLFVIFVNSLLHKLETATLYNR